MHCHPEADQRKSTFLWHHHGRGDCVQTPGHLIGPPSAWGRSQATRRWIAATLLWSGNNLPMAGASRSRPMGRCGECPLPSEGGRSKSDGWHPSQGVPHAAGLRQRPYRRAPEIATPPGGLLRGFRLCAAPRRRPQVRSRKSHTLPGRGRGREIASTNRACLTPRYRRPRGAGVGSASAGTVLGEPRS